MKNNLKKLRIVYNDTLLNEFDECTFNIFDNNKETIIKISKKETKLDDSRVYQGA